MAVGDAIKNIEWRQEPMLSAASRKVLHQRGLAAGYHAYLYVIAAYHYLMINWKVLRWARWTIAIWGCMVSTRFDTVVDMPGPDTV